MKSMSKFISYKQWLNEAITPSVNKHMTHAEDLVILGGDDGLNWVIDMFKKLYRKLIGNTDVPELKLSIKFDGAPSVFVWSKFPGLEKPGVAIKGLFAKDRKVMFSNADVDKFYGPQPDLALKLKILLKYLPIIGIPENQIWQGDLLFDKASLIQDEKFYSFHPNTIVYKVPKDSDIGKEIATADIGVVWHTRYMGDSLETISAKYNTKTGELKKNPKFFMTDPYIASLAGYVTLTEEENKDISNKLAQIQSNAKTLYSRPSYNTIKNNQELVTLFTTFQNRLIRDQETVKGPDDFYSRYVQFVTDRYDKEVEKKKTDVGKQSVIDKRDNILKDIQTVKPTLLLVIETILKITQLKSIFIKKLNNIGKFQTYLKTNAGKFRSTSQEGFAVSDIDGNVIKLVDRNEFSYANFSPDIIKGWSK